MRTAHLSTCARDTQKGEKFYASFVAVLARTDDTDELVEVRQCDEITFQQFGAFLGLAQFKARATQNDFAPMLDIALDEAP